MNKRIRPRNTTKSYEELKEWWTYNCNYKTSSSWQKKPGTILQASHNYWTQIAEDIFSISEDLQNIIQSDMEKQAYHIQSLLVDKLDNYKGKENKYAKEYIKEIQDTYKQEDMVVKMPQNIDKEKQRRGSFSL